MASTLYKIAIFVALIVSLFTRINELGAFCYDIEKGKSINKNSRSPTITDFEKIISVSAIRLIPEYNNFDPDLYSLIVSAYPTLTTNFVDPKYIEIPSDSSYVTITGLESNIEYTIQIAIKDQDDNAIQNYAQAATTSQYPDYINSVINKNGTLSYTTEYDGNTKSTDCVILLVSDDKPPNSGEILDCFTPNLPLKYNDHSSQFEELKDNSINANYLSKFNRKSDLNKVNKRLVYDKYSCSCTEGTAIIYRPLAPREKIYLADSLYGIISEPLLVGFDVGKLSAGEIIALSVGSVLILLLVLGGIYLIKKRKV